MMSGKQQPNSVGSIATPRVIAARYVNARSGRVLLRWSLAFVALALGGCESLRVPAIDPTGERIFATNQSTAVSAGSNARCLNLSGGSCFPKPAWQQSPTPPPCPQPPQPAAPAQPSTVTTPPIRLDRGIPGQLSVTPGRLIAPVGSEVVLTGGLCGEDGHFVMRQPLEWMLSQDSVGHIVDVSDRQGSWNPHSKKLSADYAVTRTGTRLQVVTRGTPSVTDDVIQQKGQGWISVTSPNEGTSYVTVVAPTGKTWPQRRQTSTIYWIDAQWAFPGPMTVTAGRPHTLTTTVTRTGTGAPVIGWIVRYEVVGGAPATFGGPGNSTEVRTDDNGNGTVQLRPSGLSPGVTQIRMQVVRPPDPSSDAPRTVIGEGYTSITWSAPGLTLSVTGPQVGSLDSVLPYRVIVTNPGDLMTRGVTVRDFLPPSLKFVSSNPPAQLFGDRAEWRLGDLAPKASRVLEVSCRAVAGGNVRYRFQASSADGLQADAQVDTEISRPTLSLDVSGPQTATVGETVEYRVQVTNTGSRAFDDVTISDRYDAGLEHADGQASPIQRSLGRLDPNQTKRIAVVFVVRRAGRLCHTLEVTTPDGQFARSESCVTVADAAVVPKPTLTVRKMGPSEARVGQSVTFAVEVFNTGNVPLTNVRIADTYHTALEPEKASPGVDENALAQDQLVWNIPQLPPGQKQRREVQCVCMQATDRAASQVVVTSDQTTPQTSEAVVRIRPAVGATPTPPLPGGPGTGVEGPAAARGQLKVDISELGDPINTGGRTVYMITITNDRPAPDQRVTLVLQFSAGLRFEKLEGPVRIQNNSPDGQTITLSPVQEMRAGEKLRPFRIEASGTAPGQQTLLVRVSSQLSPEGVEASETTTVVANQ